MIAAIPPGYATASPGISDGPPYKDELDAFEQMWLENGAAELKNAHSSAIANHLHTLSLKGEGSPELFQAIEEELLANDHQKLNECGVVALKWVVCAFGQRNLGSSTLYEAILERLLDNDAQFARQYTNEWQSEIFDSFRGSGVDYSELLNAFSRARNDDRPIFQ